MPSTTSQIRLLETLSIEIFPEDLAAAVKTGANNARILEMAGKVLATAQGLWRPQAVLRWLGVDRVTGGIVVLSSLDGGEAGCLHLGHAACFMAPATYGLVAVFTAGDELETQAAMASKEKRVMDAYLYDLIGLAVLEKTRRRINGIVEEKAREMNWGVGPFLSPGSVHGWELDDQENLCRLVPLARIGVKNENGVLRPFRTVSCLIGIGPKFTTKTVGATCDVCSNRDRCELRATS